MHTKTPFAVASLLLVAACATRGHHVAGSSAANFLGVVPTAMPKVATTAPVVAPEGDVDAADGRLEDVLPAGSGLDHWTADAAAQAPGRAPRWRDRGAILQGFFGASIFDLERSRGGTTVSADDVEIPSIGGGGQWKLAGDKIDVGLEGLLGFNWRASSTAVAIGGGGAAVAVDVDVFLMDFYGGPFASVFLGDGMRIYAGAGPLMQWLFYDERSLSSDDGSGFGLGYYARTGLEFHLGRGSLIGAGVRWSDSSVDVGGNLGDVDMDGFMWMITYSYFY